MDTSEAWDSGYIASQNGKSKLENPYPHGSDHADAWDDGWETGNPDMEDATFCAFCEMTHWPSDEDESNSTWQQWRCDECGKWNDRATD